MKEVLEELARRRATASLGGGEKRIEAQHRRGKLTAASASSCCSSGIGSGGISLHMPGRNPREAGIQ